MTRALKLARLAEQQKDRPFGCVVVDEMNQMVSEAWGTGRHNDPLRHSEMLAINEACRVKDGLLDGCTLYSTHEPCLMCTGAIHHAEISIVVFGSYREDLPDLFRPYATDWHRWCERTKPPVVIGGLLRGECIDLFARDLASVRSHRP